MFNCRPQLILNKISVINWNENEPHIWGVQLRKNVITNMKIISLIMLGLLYIAWGSVIA
jgi:hypothetical protein